MSTKTDANCATTVQPAVKQPSLRAFVESYILNHLDTSEHPAFGIVQQNAYVLSGRPLPETSPSAPLLFLPAESSFDGENVTDAGDAPEEETPLEDFYRDADEEANRLKRAMEDYQALLEPKKREKKLQFPENIKTWEDVLGEIEREAIQYNDPGGISGKIRKWFRKSSSNAAAVTSWMDLLPAHSQYFSVICGGLKLIVGAASRLNDLRDDIARALMRIPTLLSCTNRDLNVYMNSKELHRCSSELFVAAIAIIEHILRYYHTKRAKKLLGAIFGQGGFGQGLSDKIDELALRADNFTRVADTCGREIGVDTRQKVKE